MIDWHYGLKLYSSGHATISGLSGFKGQGGKEEHSEEKHSCSNLEEAGGDELHIQLLWGGSALRLLRLWNEQRGKGITILTIEMEIAWQLSF